MRIFKQWYEEDKFCKEDELLFCNCDMYERATLPQLMRDMADLAGEDYSERGMSHQVLLEHGAVFLISRMSIHFERTPKASEIITAKTWEQCCKKMQLFRDYEVFDEDNKKVISCESSWVIVEPKEHKIIRPSNFELHEFPTLERNIECMECGKIVIPRELKHLGDRCILFSDIDGNKHVNNSKYAAMAMDYLPRSLLVKDLSDFRINFSNEAKLDDCITIWGDIKESENYALIAGKKDSGLCFSCEFYFRE